MRITDVSQLGEMPEGELIETFSVLRHPGALVVSSTRPLEKNAAVSTARALRRVPAPTVLVVEDPAAEDPDVVEVLTSGFDVCLSRNTRPPPPWVNADADELDDVVARQPLATLALVCLLRTTELLCTWDAVAQESATYAMLLGSAPFLGWLSERVSRPVKSSADPVVKVDRRDRVLRVTLDRVEARNAIDSQMRDELVGALRVASVEPELEVELRGNGPCFSSGGDLGEFGTVGDPATAHAVRLTRHPGLALAEVASRTRCYLHGTCIGAGVEIPAFADDVTAHPKATFALPEIAMGLVPGAGGTASITRRIGRHRAAWMMLTGATIDSPTALEWRLVDVVDPAAFAPEG